MGRVQLAIGCKSTWSGFLTCASCGSFFGWRTLVGMTSSEEMVIKLKKRNITFGGSKLKMREAQLQEEKGYLGPS